MTSTEVLQETVCRMLLLSTTLWVVGCDRQISASHRAAAESMYSDALDDMADSRFQDALARLNRIVTDADVSPDVLADVLIRRSVCHAQCGDTTAALRDLEQVISEAPPDVYWAARSFVLSKAGRTAEARDARRKAEELNPHVQAW